MKLLITQIACRRCSNYISILNLTQGFIGLGKDNCKTRREIVVFGDLVRLILENWRYVVVFIRVIIHTMIRRHLLHAHKSRKSEWNRNYFVIALHSSRQILVLGLVWQTIPLSNACSWKHQWMNDTHLNYFLACYYVLIIDGQWIGLLLFYMWFSTAH